MLSATTAYPSIVARSNPGTSTSLTTAAANTRPAAIRRGTISSPGGRNVRVEPGQGGVDRMSVREAAHPHIVHRVACRGRPCGFVQPV